MKLSIVEFRDMVAEAVRRTVREARKKKDIPPHSEESAASQRDRHVRALPGYSHGDSALDMSTPLGRKNLAKRQGATGMGNWTAEGRILESDDAQLKGLTHVLIANGMTPEVALKAAGEILQKMSKHAWVDHAATGLDDPSELEIEARDVRHEAVRRLVRMVVAEEVRARRGR